MSVEKLFPSGVVVVSDVIGGHLVRRTYYGLTKRQAAALFRADCKKNARAS